MLLYDYCFLIGIKIDYRTEIGFVKPIYFNNYCKKAGLIIEDWITQRKK